VGTAGRVNTITPPRDSRVAGEEVSMAAARTESPDLARNVLVVLFILGLTAGCLWILRPFLVAMICAATLAISTWPMLTGLQKRLGGKRWAAIAVMVGALMIAFLAPIYFGTIALVQSVTATVAWVHDLPHRTVPQLPAWLANLPLVGAGLQDAWAGASADGGEGLRTRLAENSSEIMGWLIVRIGGLAGVLAQVMVTLGITGLLYVRGEMVSNAVLRFARRLSSDHGENAARLAALAARGVALGVVLTPFIQSVLAAIGMATAGVPRFGLIAVGVLVSCLAQAGPLPVLALPVIWLFSRGSTVPAIGLLAWAFVVHISGPIIRPMLIKRGVDLPFAVIIAGVIGGVAAFGVVGLFIGPVMLAVAITLLDRWMADGETATSRGA
jgi:predicted PurR-regulated permease PerM